METKPSIRTKENRQKLKEGFLFGCTLEEAALYAGISTRALFDWRADDEEFAEEIDLWRQNPTILARKTVYDKMNGDGKLAMEYLRHKRSDEFNTKTNTDVTSQGEKIQTLAVEFIDAKGNANPDGV